MKILEVDDLALRPCPKHRECTIGCKDCKVVHEKKWYELPPIDRKKPTR
jgi:hypothetical protein